MLKPLDSTQAIVLQTLYFQDINVLFSSKDLKLDVVLQKQLLNIQNTSKFVGKQFVVFLL